MWPRDILGRDKLKIRIIFVWLLSCVLFHQNCAGVVLGNQRETSESSSSLMSGFAAGRYVVKISVLAGASMGGKRVASQVPFFYVLSRGRVDRDQRQVRVKKHDQDRYVVFDEADTVDQTSYIGAYVPTGHVARFRFSYQDKLNGRCSSPGRNQFSNWEFYQLPIKGDRNTISPLRISVSPLDNQLQPDQCLFVQWLLQKRSDDEYLHEVGGTYSDLVEQPSIATNTPKEMPITDILEVNSTNPHGAGVLLALSETFGGVPRELKIRTQGNDNGYVSILVNGAPTDDGLVWGIPAYSVRGLYSENDVLVNIGSSQFVGHTKNGSTFSHSMWGFRVPLELVNNSATYQRLETPQSYCGSSGRPCFFPMYTDFSQNAVNKVTRESTPFFHQHSAHPWDGRIKGITAAILNDSNGMKSSLARLRYDFEFRPHLEFTAIEGIKPHFWFNQSLNNHVNVYLVNSLDQTSMMSYQDLFQPGGLIYSENKYQKPTDNQHAIANENFSQFCNSDGVNFCTKENQNQNNDMSCQCSLKNFYKRVIFEYVDHNVAIVVQGNKHLFEHLYVGTVYRTVTAQPFILVSASNMDQRGEYLDFNPRVDLFEDNFFFTIGTMENLKKRGLGTTD